MNADILQRSYSTVGSVLANVKDDQLDDPTPCASWKVRDIINHVVGGTTFFASAAETGAADHGPADPTDFASGDFRKEFAEGSKRAVEAFSAPGVMEKIINLGFMEVPGAVVIGIATTDAFVHAWDIAHATGQPVDLDPEFAAQLLENSRRMVRPEFRGAEGKAPFGAEQQADESAPAATKLAAFMGRRP